MIRRDHPLTPEQEAELPRYSERWLERGLATGPCDRSAVEAAMREVYAAAGRTPPEIVIWMSSPLGGCVSAWALTQLRDQLWDQLGGQLGDQLWGQLGGQLRGQLREQLRGQLWDQLSHAIHGSHETPWIAWYSFARSIGVKLTEAQDRWLTAMGTMCHAGWWWPFEGGVVLTERPVSLHRDAQGRLHHSSEMATAYADGWGIWAIHGVRVTEQIVAHPETLTPAEIMGEQNVEVCRVAAERYGWERLLGSSKLVDICDDPGNPGQRIRLYNLPREMWAAATPLRLLLGVNGATEPDGSRRRYGLTVPAEIGSALSAAAWTYELSGEIYATCARRA